MFRIPLRSRYRATKPIRGTTPLPSSKTRMPAAGLRAGMAPGRLPAGCGTAFARFRRPRRRRPVREALRGVSSSQFTPDLEARFAVPGAPRISRPPYEYLAPDGAVLSVARAVARLLAGAGARALPGGPPRVRAVMCTAVTVRSGRQVAARCPTRGRPVPDVRHSEFALARDPVIPRRARYKRQRASRSRRRWLVRATPGFGAAINSRLVTGHGGEREAHSE